MHFGSAASKDSRTACRALKERGITGRHATLWDSGSLYDLNTLLDGSESSVYSGTRVVSDHSTTVCFCDASGGGSPSFSKDDGERLLAHMDVTRSLTINYAAAYGYHSPQYALGTSLTSAIDKLAEQITGDSQFFWMSGHSAGSQSPNQERATARQERELRWRELRRKY